MNKNREYIINTQNNFAFILNNYQYPTILITKFIMS